MRKFLSFIFIVPGWIIVAGVGIWTFIFCLRVVYDIAGFWGLVIGFTILPVTFTVAPWYVLIAFGNWEPLIISYGGMILGGGLIMAGKGIRGDL